MSEPVFPALSDDCLARIAGDMDRQGFGVAVDCISVDHLASLRLFVERKVADAGGEYIALTGLDGVRDTLLGMLASSPEFMQAVRAIYRKGVGEPAPDKPFYQVLRCLSGRIGERYAYLFHYDSYVVTALVPIIMPSTGRAGDLIMFPNTRTIRKTYLRNLVDKVLLDNILTQMAPKRIATSRTRRPTLVRMRPGNVYFFWGYRSVHANEPCDHDQIRATALFHYVNPHAGSRIRRVTTREAPAA
ncbi:hypothetical protein HLH33_06410 [Gluconacetobacter diazotrophicus]|uniref:Prolyl 4-hydroxylase alpha subunit Fe(2+) 2OG dioxygenase domain-containing protein n=1 Tax=Gluconacetobacter diazotrophicus TaxID=33996 RepID=A0A7W4I4L0_GLUDI|nr:hypothetical protein [Gluconacetobacter diazotrophicus]MBB2155941.1 hypothetical protein [Gluconacetobacter diazotrophicus]